MKEELRTLKDIEYDKNRLFTDAVKQEAIKWVKNWQKESWTQNPEPAEAFIDFFNLTEEDLQEKN